MNHFTTGFRRGYSAVLAMIFIVIGTTMVGGFASMLNSSRSLAGNHRSVMEAAKAAESGMNFLVLKITDAAQVADLRSRDSTVWMGPLTTKLREALEATGNLPDGQILQASADGVSLLIPKVTLLDSTSFSAILSPSVIADDDGLTLQVTGFSRDGAVRRTMAVNLNSTPERFLDGGKFAMVARKGISQKGSASILGYGPSTGSPDGTVGALARLGDDPNALPKVVVLQAPDAPIPVFRDVVDIAFPATDTRFLDVGYTSQLSKFAAVGKKGTPPSVVTNSYIPANTNPSFNDVELKGLIYVEWPNNINFNGNTKLSGVIVYQPAPADSTATSVIAIARTAPLINDRNTAAANIAALTWLTEEQRTFLSAWSILAPSTDLAISNGNAVVKQFQSSLHIQSLLKEAGQGSSEAGLVLNQAALYAEGTIDMTGNRVFWVAPPAGNSDSDTSVRIRELHVLHMTYGEYREPLAYAKEPS